MARRTSRLLIVGLMLIGLMPVATLYSMPPHPSLMQAIENGDGPMPYALAHRSELLAKGVDSPWAPDDNRERLAKRLTAGSSSYNLLCILVQFSDKAATVPASDYDSLLFTSQAPSVRHYYNEVSYGTLDIVTVNMPSALDWQTAPSTYAYYCNGQSGLGSYPQNCQKLVEDLVALVDPVVNFANYDDNGDGYVDGLTIVHSGKGAEAEANPTLANSLIWSHKWNTSSAVNVDGKQVFYYSIEPEFIYSAGDATIGVFCHELGHSIFHLPDLYDTDYSSNGIGLWSIMSVGSWNGPALLGESPAAPDAWCRIQCGFATPNVISVNANGHAIPNIENNSDGIYRLWNNGTASDEYFLVENRQQTGYDTYLPGNGLLIYHIDENVSTDNDNEWYPGHTFSGHYLVALEQADSLYQLEKFQNYGDVGDPFPGSFAAVSFSNGSTPSSRTYAGASTLVAVNNISASGPVMHADLQVALAAEVDDNTYEPALPTSIDLSQNYPNPFNPTTRITFDLPATMYARLSVHNLLGQLVETLIDANLPAGTYQFDWTAHDSHVNALPSGIYFYRLQADGLSLTRKMILLK
jgi:immune inhibitor A